MVMDGIIINIVIYVIGLFILYLVIETAVKNGINSSLLGKYLAEKHGIKEEKSSILKVDLDDDKSDQ